MDLNITRDNFDEFWLASDTCEQNYTKFRFIPLKEKQGCRNLVKNALSKAILDHHLNPLTISRALERLGYAQAANYFSARLPKSKTTRKGNFGEVVASEHLRQRYHYDMPVFKLRYSENFDMPMRGEDIVAFEIDRNGKIITICIGEVKTNEDYQTAHVRKAHLRLVKTYHPSPVTLSLISEILRDRDNNDLAEQIDMIYENLVLENNFPRHNWIFIITGNQKIDPFRPLEEINGVVENLKAVHLYLPELSIFIDEIFNISVF